MHINRDLITLYNSVYANMDHDDRSGIPRKQISLFNQELATLGYTLSPEFLSSMIFISYPDFMIIRKDLLKVLGEITGADKNHQALFANFPYSTPKQYSYLNARIIGHFQSTYGIVFSNKYTILSNGAIIDASLFNLTDFGADPITQYQVPEILDRSSKKYEFKNITPLKILNLVAVDDLAKIATDLLARNSSLSKQEKDLLVAMVQIPYLSMDPHPVAYPEKAYKETLPFIFKHLDPEHSYTKTQLSGATDVLRIAYYLSDPEADLSLKENVKFKLTSSEKRSILTLLEGLGNIEEDLLRYRERWLRLGERLNPATPQNQLRFPKTAKAFDMIRNYNGNIETFNRKVETKISNKLFDETLVDTLKSRPGEFARRIDLMLRDAKASKPFRATVLTAMRNDVVGKLTLPMLFTLMKYFGSRNTSVGERIFFPKGNVNRAQVVVDERETLSVDVITILNDLIEEEIIRRFKTKNANLGKVYVDPTLKNIILPFNRRGDSKTNTNLIKGSKYKFNPNAKVVRLFTYWKGHVDIDLSVNLYDTDWNLVENVAFYNLEGRGIVHSGDIRSAPNGAAEFIDLELSRLDDRVVYVVPSLISYNGEGFKNVEECFVGVMERDSLRSGEKFEPASVKFKFDVKSDNTSYNPIAFDLTNGEITVIDMSFGNHRYGHSVGQNDTLSALARSIMNLTSVKPTAFDVLDLYVSQNGEFTMDRQDADLVFDSETLNIDDVLKLLA